MKATLFWCLICLGAFLLFCPQHGLSQVAIIVNDSVPIESASSKKIADIYQLKLRRWQDDTRITVFNLKKESQVKSQFYSFINQKTLNLRKRWLRLQLTGEATPPKAVETEKEMVEKVATTPGAIGFVSKEHLNEDVKVVALIE